MKRKKLSREIFFVLVLLAGIIFALFLFMYQNQNRILEQNKNYAADSARQNAKRVEGEFNSALQSINNYVYFFNSNQNKSVLDKDLLRDLEEHSMFDAIRFTKADGLNIASSGETSDSSDRSYFVKGMNGKTGLEVVEKSRLTNRPMMVFYAPLKQNNKIYGMLLGLYFADDYLQDMLSTSYFGEQADVYLCTVEGRVVASSGGDAYEGSLVDGLNKEGVIDAHTAASVREIFQKGGEGVFSCESNSRTDNICVTNLPDYDFVLVQTFPKSVTQKMLWNANKVGIELVLFLLGLFVLYVIVLVIHAAQEQRKLERENREMGYVINGVSTLFSRFAMVDLNQGTYQYLAGTVPEDGSIAVCGNYEELKKYLCSLMPVESAREEFAREIEREAIAEALSGQNDLRFECYVMLNGRPEWKHINVICLERTDGRADKVLLAQQNITEIKEKELHIQREMAIAYRKERQYQSAITSSAFSMFEFNLTRDLIEEDITRMVNGKRISLLEKIGISAPCRASECFEKWKAFILKESLPQFEEIIDLEKLKERFEQGEREVVVDYWGLAMYEEPMCVRQTLIMLQDDDTGDIMCLSFSKDITAQVQAQREQTLALQDALMQAQHANQAKTTFLSNMSHDIRTPMNAIIGFTTIAVSHIDNKAQVQDCLQKVLSSSNHLLSLINDILDMSRIESGKVQIKEQECNISELMHNLVNIIQPQVKAKQLELFIDTFEVNNEDVIADPLKLNQIFINLLSNAVKYTPAGGTVTFRIIQKTTYRHGYGDYIFIVKDNGIGMSPEFVKHVFEPFERETTVTQSGIQGTGLGMAITKNIVEMMNGTIRAESEPGKGSTFTVEFSLKLQDLEENATQIKELEGLRALVVDDDPNTCDSVNKMLKQIGLRSEWTVSGREAVYRAKASDEEGDPYHTYIIDWQMPGMSGVETAHKIRQTVRQETPIIILTAYDWTDIEKEAREAGVTAFCAKPLFMSDLKSVLLTVNNLDGDREESAPVWSQADFSGKRVLLVDDNELNREIAEVILEETGFSVETAPDGTDAVSMVEHAQENYYDAILMDVQMPVMDGYEATRTIRKLPRKDVKHLPIIAMTANAMEEDKEEALKNGMNAHLAKPLNVESFIALLQKLVR